VQTGAFDGVDGRRRADGLDRKICEPIRTLAGRGMTHSRPTEKIQKQKKSRLRDSVAIGAAERDGK
jgi:hypothetical protein